MNERKTITFEIDNSYGLDEEEEKAAQNIERTLSGLELGKVKRVLAQIISNMNRVPYLPSV